LTQAKGAYNAIHRHLNKETQTLHVVGGRPCQLSSSLIYGAVERENSSPRAVAWQRGSGGGWAEERERRGIGRGGVVRVVSANIIITRHAVVTECRQRPISLQVSP